MTKYISNRNFIFQNPNKQFYAVFMNQDTGVATARLLGSFVRPYKSTDTVTTVEFDAAKAKTYITSAVDARGIWGASGTSTLGSILNAS